MKIHKVYDLFFDTEETIITAALSKSNEVIILWSSGNVNKFDLDDKKGEYLFSVKSEIGYPDGGFDLTAKSTIYATDKIVVLVNDFKTHGIVHYEDNYQALRLWRDDYHASISTYPIAIYKSKEGVPHLIFAEAWNHIQIMNLDTRQVLTAAKSLIEENAEERHLEFYKNHEEHSKLKWPRPYDYFFGKLYVSPNQEKFLSAGWVWGSFDCYNVYEIDQFISSNRISDMTIGSWEHEGRAACWIDNETIGILYNPFMEGEENSTIDSPCEIHFYKINGNKAEVESKIQIAVKSIVNSRLYFEKNISSFVICSETEGLTIISIEGQILFKDQNLNVTEYDNEKGLFIVEENNTISVCKIIA